MLTEKVRKAMSSKTQLEVIDIHSHLYPRPYIELLKQRDHIPRVVTRNGIEKFVIFPEEDGPHGVGGRSIGPEFWDLDLKLEFMDKVGIDRTVVSLGNPWLDPFQGSTGEEAARMVNRFMADCEATTSGRVVGLGVVPANSVDSAISEASAIAAIDGLHGLVLGPRVAGLTFDDPALEPFWAEIQSLGLPVFVHPKDGVALDALRGYRHVLPVGLGFPMETTIAIARLVLGGVLHRFPDLRLMLAHGGGCLPYLAGRLDAAWRSDPAVEKQLPLPPSAYLRRLRLDALVYYGGAFSAAMQLVGAERLMFGSDHPFTVADPQANLETIFAELEDRNRLANVLAQNAREFFALDEA